MADGVFFSLAFDVLRYAPREPFTSPTGFAALLSTSPMHTHSYSVSPFYSSSLCLFLSLLPIIRSRRSGATIGMYRTRCAAVSKQSICIRSNGTAGEFPCNRQPSNLFLFLAVALPNGGAPSYNRWCPKEEPRHSPPSFGPEPERWRRTRQASKLEACCALMAAQGPNA